MNITEDDLLEIASAFPKSKSNNLSKVVGHCLYFRARRAVTGCAFSFHYRSKSNHEEFHQVIGHYPDMTLEEARREAAKLDKKREMSGQRTRHLKCVNHKETEVTEQAEPRKTGQPDYFFETPFGSVSIKCPRPDDLPRLLKSLSAFGGSFNG